MRELKPCPFCGSDNSGVHQSAYYYDDGTFAKDTYQARCYNCGSSGALCWTYKAAVESWNRRTHKLTPHKASQLYALYKNDELLAVGTAYELADYMGVKLDTFYWYTYPSAKKRLENRKSGGYHVERIEE